LWLERFCGREATVLSHGTAGDFVYGVIISGSRISQKPALSAVQLSEQGWRRPLLAAVWATATRAAAKCPNLEHWDWGKNGHNGKRAGNRCRCDRVGQGRVKRRNNECLEIHCSVAGSGDKSAAAGVGLQGQT
jgi:hypothetical protein